MRWLLLTESTCNPRLSSAAVVARTVARVAPKTAPKVAGRRYRRNCGEPGVETAAANAANATGSRGRRAMSSSIGFDPGTRPSRTAPRGTTGADPTRTNPAGGRLHRATDDDAVAELARTTGATDTARNAPTPTVPRSARLRVLGNRVPATPRCGSARCIEISLFGGSSWTRSVVAAWSMKGPARRREGRKAPAVVVTIARRRLSS